MEFDSNEFESKSQKEDKAIINPTEIKRELDSMDDFEHLDPEITPVKVIQAPSVLDQSKKDMTQNLLDVPFSVSNPATNDIKDTTLESLTNAVKSPIQNISETVKSGNDFPSNFSTKAQETETSIFDSVQFHNFEANHKTKIPNLLNDFKDEDPAVHTKYDVMKFLEAETSGTKKADNESDLNLIDDVLNSKHLLSEVPKHLKSFDGFSSQDNVSKEDLNSLIIESNKTEDEESKILNFETEKLNYNIDSMSSIAEVDITNSQIKENSPFHDVSNSRVNDIFEPSDDNKQDENIVPIKQTEPFHSTEMDEFLDTEPVLNESVEIIKPNFITKPVPLSTIIDKVVIPKEEPKVSIRNSPSLDDIIGPEDVFKKIGLDAWFNPDRLHPKVEALIYWRDPKKSGIVFGSILVILLSLAYLSLISVVAYVSLLTLFGTIVFRVYKSVLQAVQKTSDGHPFKEFLDLELTLPQDKVREFTDTAVTHINAAVAELRRLFLVEDMVDSIKFAVLLWCLTYIGALFNGLTLVILGFVALFTVPKVYENNKTSIDAYLDIGRSKIAEITSKVKAAIPIGKKDADKEKDQ
uniref:Reticulon-like protein n=1 Tax=Clastoptera arizonana TaxID=38151 RepID=A0A1B6CF41_9HEMI